MLSSCRRCIADDVVGAGVVNNFAHGVGDDGDDVRGCRTGIASRIDRGELGQVIRVTVSVMMQVRSTSMCVCRSC